MFAELDINEKSFPLLTLQDLYRCAEGLATAGSLWHTHAYTSTRTHAYAHARTRARAHAPHIFMP